MAEAYEEIHRDIELRTIRILHAIDREGSITAAAGRLGYSQPAVSQHLQRAESRIGMPLITRLGRSVKLTEAGSMIAEVSDSVIGEVDAVIGRLEDLTQLRSGRVRMCGFPSASATLVPTLLDHVRTARPGISISYSESGPQESLAAIAVGDSDIALVCHYRDDDPRSGATVDGVEITPLFIDPLFAVLPADHPLATETAVDVRDLDEDEWISGWHAEEVCERVGFAPNVTLRTENFMAVLGLVARGFGVSILPRMPLFTVVIPQGCVIRPLTQREFRTIYVATTAERAAVPAVKLTTTLLEQLDGSQWKLQRPGESD